jgi:5-methylcytosine-specific restriction endonuclease McrA
MRSIDATCCWCGKHYKKKPSDRKTKKVFCSRKCMGEWQSKYVIGELSYNWNGGVTQLNHRIRSLVKYAEWMKKIYKRDNYTCCVCGDANGGNLNAHYIKPLYKIIRDNNLIDLIDALECSEIWDTNNGKTICEKCHIEEHKGKREE